MIFKEYAEQQFDDDDLIDTLVESTVFDLSHNVLFGLNTDGSLNEDECGRYDEYDEYDEYNGYNDYDEYDDYSLLDEDERTTAEHWASGVRRRENSSNDGSGANGKRGRRVEWTGSNSGTSSGSRKPGRPRKPKTTTDASSTTGTDTDTDTGSSSGTGSRKSGRSRKPSSGSSSTGSRKPGRPRKTGTDSSSSETGSGSSSGSRSGSSGSGSRKPGGSGSGGSGSGGSGGSGSGGSGSGRSGSGGSGSGGSGRSGSGSGSGGSGSGSSGSGGSGGSGSGGSGGSGSGGSGGSGSGGSGSTDDTDARMQKEIEKLATTFWNCALFLGKQRMVGVAKVLNNNRTQLAALKHSEEAIAGVDDEEAKRTYTEKRDELLAEVYRALRVVINKEDATGREDIKLMYKNRRFLIVDKKTNKPINEGVIANTVASAAAGAGVGLLGGGVGAAVGGLVGGLIGLLLGLGKAAAKKLFNKWESRSTEESFNRGCDTRCFDSIYRCDDKDIDKNMSDEEKGSAGVSWTKKVNDSDLKVMAGNNDHNFLKQVVLLSAKYGPRALKDLKEVCEKANRK